MSTTLVRRTGTEVLATRINREHENALGSARQMVHHAINCGNLLIEAKQGLQHGEWGAWLGEHFAGSEWTAQAYMRLARAEVAKPGSISGFELIDAALKSISSSRRPSLPRATVDPDSDVGRLYGAVRSAARGGEHVVDAEAVDDAPPGVEFRRWTAVLGQVDGVRRSMAEAARGDLSAQSAAEALTEASITARRAAVDLERLADAVRRRAL